MQLLCETKIRQLHMPVPIQQYVLRFQIPVHDVVLVQMLQRAGDLRGEEARGGALEAPHVAQVGEEFAAACVLQQHVEEGVGVMGP